MPGGIVAHRAIESGQNGHPQLQKCRLPNVEKLLDLARCLEHCWTAKLKPITTSNADEEARHILPTVR